METQIFILIMSMVVSCGYAAKPKDDAVSKEVSSNGNSNAPRITKLETESNTVSGNGGILTVKVKTDSKGKVVIRTTTDKPEAKDCYPNNPNCKNASKDIYQGDAEVNTEQTIKIKGSDLYSNYNRLYLSVTNQEGTEGKFFYVTREDEPAFSYIQPVNEVVRGNSLVAKVTANKNNAKIYYQVGNGKTQEYDAKVGIRIEHPIPQFIFNFPVSITYYSVDEAGNVEYPKTKNYTIVPTETRLTVNPASMVIQKSYH